MNHPKLKKSYYNKIIPKKYNKKMKLDRTIKNLNKRKELKNKIYLSINKT